METVDILGIVAHPDDVELSFGGTLIKHQKLGYKTGVVDLTRGELGTRGTPEIRYKEALEASKIMKLSIRDNLELEDGFFENNRQNQLKVIQAIRRYQPKVVITNSIYDRHPDHARGAELVEQAFFKAGLKAVETVFNNQKQNPHRPDKLYFCIQSTAHEPDIIINISDEIEQRRNAIKAFKSQFYDPNSTEPETYISSGNFMDMLEARSIEWGMRIGVKYAEGFRVKHAIGVNNLFDLL